MAKTFTIIAHDDDSIKIANQQLFELMNIEGYCAHDAAVEVMMRAADEDVEITITVNKEGA